MGRAGSRGCRPLHPPPRMDRGGGTGCLHRPWTRQGCTITPIGGHGRRPVFMHPCLGLPESSQSSTTAALWGSSSSSARSQVDRESGEETQLRRLTEPDALAPQLTATPHRPPVATRRSPVETQSACLSTPERASADRLSPRRGSLARSTLRSRNARRNPQRASANWPWCSLEQPRLVPLARVSPPCIRFPCSTSGDLRRETPGREKGSLDGLSLSPVSPGAQADRHRQWCHLSLERSLRLGGVAGEDEEHLELPAWAGWRLA